LDGPIQRGLFDGSFSHWWLQTFDVSYDQRNALVVGLAMGFAVVPTIFTIAEDALHAVPKSLSDGSLALGATAWQTVTMLVVPAASPGLFSALMIGLGRAAGETMIVLMATGNTPLMNWNIFEGMRTLAANIAVEMPESVVGSSHYRVLFLSALVLFGFTFLINSMAELVRQNLRERYSAM
jgi:phosphate transport system permease protein